MGTTYLLLETEKKRAEQWCLSPLSFLLSLFAPVPTICSSPPADLRWKNQQWRHRFTVDVSFWVFFCFSCCRDTTMAGTILVGVYAAFFSCSLRVALFFLFFFFWCFSSFFLGGFSFSLYFLGCVLFAPFFWVDYSVFLGSSSSVLLRFFSPLAIAFALLFIEPAAVLGGNGCPPPKWS